MATRLLVCVFIFFVQLEGYAKKPVEKFFLLNDSTKLSYTKLIDIRYDTVFFLGNTSKEYVLVDSIHSLCEYKHGHRLRGGIIGFFGGIILGTALGAAFTPSSDGFEQLGGATIGLLIGAVTGTGIGIAAGSGKKFDLDLSKYDHGKRIIILKSLLSER